MHHAQYKEYPPSNNSHFFLLLRMASSGRDSSTTMDDFLITSEDREIDYRSSGLSEIDEGPLEELLLDPKKKEWKLRRWACQDCRRTPSGKDDSSNHPTPSGMDTGAGQTGLPPPWQPYW